MKAAVIVGKGKIEIEELPKPVPGPGLVLLKVIYCSICGSDVEFLYGPHWEMANKELTRMKETIRGHEDVVRVEALGEGVSGWTVGDRVVIAHYPCGTCYYCKRGLSDLCLHGRVRGHPYDGTPSPIPNVHRLGSMAEYILRIPASLLKVPDAVSDEEAAMTEPLATGVTAVHPARIQIGDSVAVIGLGYIGLMVLGAAIAAGAAPLIAVDKNKDRLAIAGKMGANVLLNPDETDVVQEAVEATQAGPDFAFSCVSSGAKGVLEQAFEMVRRKGRVIIVGNSAPATFSTSKWMTKEVRVEGVVHMGQKMYHALKLMEFKRVNVRPVITEIIPLEEAQRAFESLREHKNLAVLLKP